MKTKRRPPIEGNFRVLVVPEGDVTLGSTLTIPGTVRATSGDLIRVVAQFRPADGVGLNAWAFTKRTRAKTVAGLRELADYIEQHDIPDYKKFDRFTNDQYEEMLGVLRQEVEPEVDLVWQAIVGLMEFYPEIVKPDVVAKLRAKAKVPDTGNAQADYETVRDQVERLLREGG